MDRGYFRHVERHQDCVEPCCEASHKSANQENLPGGERLGHGHHDPSEQPDHLADDQTPLPPHLVRDKPAPHCPDHSPNNERWCDHCENWIGVDCAAIVRLVRLHDEQLKEVERWKIFWTAATPWWRSLGRWPPRCWSQSRTFLTPLQTPTWNCHQKLHQALIYLIKLPGEDMSHSPHLEPFPLWNIFRNVLHSQSYPHS